MHGAGACVPQAEPGPVIHGGQRGGQLQAGSLEEDKCVTSLPTIMDSEQKIKYF